MDVYDEEGKTGQAEVTLRSEPDIKLYIRFLKVLPP